MFGLKKKSMDLIEKDSVNIRFYMTLMWINSLSYQINNTLQPENDNVSIYYVNAVYFVMNAVSGTLLVISFYDRMHWIKYVTVIQFIRYCIPFCDFENYSQTYSTQKYMQRL